MKENRVGCSGFIYPGWKGTFYPNDLARSKWLAHYSSKFNTLELNASFYRFPVAKNLKTMYAATPADFRFSIKAHKIITHSMRMHNAREKINEFLDVVNEGIGDKLGCILFQLPPSLQFTEESLENILLSVPNERSSVIEFRHPSWWNQTVYDTLEKHHITFCNNDYPGMPNEIVQTKERFYMRFHGKPVLYKSEYSLPQLKKIVKNIPHECKERYVYFNNTAAVAAVANAMSIRELME
jgi:uncharacterized protein YecE (DUF72 family)